MIFFFQNGQSVSNARLDHQTEEVKAKITRRWIKLQVTIPLSVWYRNISRHLPHYFFVGSKRKRMLCKLKVTIFLSPWKRCKNRRYCTMLLFCVFYCWLLGFSLVVVWSDSLRAVIFKGSVGQTKQSTGGAAQWSQVSGEERNSADCLRSEITSLGFYLYTYVNYTIL